MTNSDVERNNKKATKKRKSSKKDRSSERHPALSDEDNAFRPARAQSPSDNFPKRESKAVSKSSGRRSEDSTGGVHRSSRDNTLVDGVPMRRKGETSENPVILQSQNNLSSSYESTSNAPVTRQQKDLSSWQFLTTENSIPSRLNPREHALHKVVDQDAFTVRKADILKKDDSDDINGHNAVEEEEEEAVRKAFDGLRVAPRHKGTTPLAELRNSYDSGSFVNESSSVVRRSTDGSVMTINSTGGAVVVGSSVVNNASVAAPVVISRSGPPRKTAKERDSERANETILNTKSVVRSSNKEFIRASNDDLEGNGETEQDSEKDISEIDKRIKALQAFLDKAR